MLKQDQYRPLSVEKQILMIFAGTRGYLDPFRVEMIKTFESEMYKYFDINHKDILKTITKTGDIDDKLMDQIEKGMDKFQKKFMKDHNIVRPEDKDKNAKSSGTTAKTKDEEQ